MFYSKTVDILMAFPSKTRDQTGKGYLQSRVSCSQSNRSPFLCCSQAVVQGGRVVGLLAGRRRRHLLVEEIHQVVLFLELSRHHAGHTGHAGPELFPDVGHLVQEATPPLQQLHQPQLPHVCEVGLPDGEARRLSSTQQQVPQAHFLVDGQVLVDQLLKQLPADVRLFLQVLLRMCGRTL